MKRKIAAVVCMLVLLLFVTGCAGGTTVRNKDAWDELFSEESLSNVTAEIEIGENLTTVKIDGDYYLEKREMGNNIYKTYGWFDRENHIMHTWNNTDRHNNYTGSWYETRLNSFEAGTQKPEFWQEYLLSLIRCDGRDDYYDLHYIDSEKCYECMNETKAEHTFRRYYVEDGRLARVIIHAHGVDIEITFRYGTTKVEFPNAVSVISYDGAGKNYCMVTE